MGKEATMGTAEKHEPSSIPSLLVTGLVCRLSHQREKAPLCSVAEAFPQHELIDSQRSTPVITDMALGNRLADESEKAGV